MVSPTTVKRWLRPEAYPLFATMGLALGICGFQLIRNITGNPEVSDRTGDEDITRLMTWPSLHATLRLEDGVAKTLLLLHINNVHDRVSSACFEHYTVEEQILTRWNPEQCLEEHVQRSPHYHFDKFSVPQSLTLTSPSPTMVDLSTRWKGKGGLKAIAPANPMSNIVAQLQSSLSQSKACGLLADFAVLLQVGIEQADLLNRACFGHPIVTTNEDNQWPILICERKKNWVVKSGIQYGVDFVAYSHHPSLVHSEYAAVVSEDNNSRNARLLAWPDLHATVRLEGGVAKTLLVLHIEKNGCDTVSTLGLKHYTVEEQTVTRWSSEHCQEDKKLLNKRS
ncbi:hypothetical protein IFM89_029494 [Coptis chinensis]|uniref:tRNA-intron lyase n=1 Tax=Coptis chinensis TaxID=261450 RepID=A0A835LTF0_9MAGN|nr:hypothetical protein IFM89_029494 [Coptis chinensis]